MPTAVEYSHLPYEDFERLRDTFWREGTSRGYIMTAEYSRQLQVGRFVFTKVTNELAQWIEKHAKLPDAVYELRESRE